MTYKKELEKEIEGGAAPVEQTPEATVPQEAAVPAATTPSPGRPWGTLEEILLGLKGIVHDDLLKTLVVEIAKLKKAAESGEAVPAPVTPRYHRPKEWDTIMKVVKSGANLLLFGPAGCGKSTAAAEVAKALGLEFTPISLGGGQRYSQVFGGMVIKDDGSTEWQPSVLLEAITKPGVILLDEVFSCYPEILIGLNSLLEPNSRQIQTPAGLYKMHPDCRVIATSNINGRLTDMIHAGQQQADSSLVSRFVSVRMGYDDTAEQQIAESAGAKGMSLLSLFKKVRNAMEHYSIQFELGTRQLIYGIKLLGAGLKEDEVADLLIWNLLSESEKSRIKKAL